MVVVRKCQKWDISAYYGRYCIRCIREMSPTVQRDTLLILLGFQSTDVIFGRAPCFTCAWTMSGHWKTKVMYYCACAFVYRFVLSGTATLKMRIRKVIFLNCLTTSYLMSRFWLTVKITNFAINVAFVLLSFFLINSFYFQIGQLLLIHPESCTFNVTSINITNTNAGVYK